MRQAHRRGYALILVLMVLALLSIGLGTLFIYQESSAKISGSLLERRRVFYACDGISRAATVLAQSYAQTAQPTTAGLINAVCKSGGGGCCATTTSTFLDPSAGTCDTDITAQFTRLEQPPSGSGESALKKIVPPGYKIMELALESIAPTCNVNGDCGLGGTCVGKRCRAVAPLPNGPFAGMSARQDTVSFGLVAEHTATSGFRCKTRQTLTLGKIAMFQFFLFSDAETTDWHPGPAMRASGRLHANGDLHIGGNLMLQRVTASGDIRRFDSPGVPCKGENCASATTLVSKVNVPDFGQPSRDFAAFSRKDLSWREDAVRDYAGNVLDRAHSVPRLQLPIVGRARVQRGHNSINVVVPNTNAASGTPLANARLLVDPVLSDDPEDIVAQKFSAKADIRIINGVWYLNAPGSTWPGEPIWSDHGTYKTTKEADFVAGIRVGQHELRARHFWGAYTPRRYSYYGMKPTLDVLELDDDQATRPTVRAVISYGTLFRDVSTAGEAAPMWRPGVRTLQTGTLQSWCEAPPAAGTVHDVSHVMLDALALDGVSSPCAGFSRAAGVLSATRSGFRDGFAEVKLCGENDNKDLDPACRAVRDQANVLPVNFDLGALQQALADPTAGELGSYFCAVDAACLMRRPFNGIVWISNPYPGSEDGYGPDGGDGVPDPMPAPNAMSDGLISGVTRASVEDDAAPASKGNWVGGPLAVLRNNPQQPDTSRVASRDDETLAVPWPLCSDDGVSPVKGLPGTQMSSRGWRYLRPKCGDAATPSTFLTGVRIINARVVNAREASATPPTAIVANAGNIEPFTKPEALLQLPDVTVPIGTNVDVSGRLPKGISVVTNHPLYVLGDVNITSDAFDTTGEKPWVPVLLAGDTIHPFSNDWDDRKARWGVSMASGTLHKGKIGTMNGTTYALETPAPTGTPRPAQVTRWYMQVLSGWGVPVKTAPPTGIHNYPFFNENWSSGTVADCGGTGAFGGECPAIIYGSLVIGHNRVYTRWPFADKADFTRSPPRRDWGFDTHLNDLDKQPPGAPIFDVSAVKQWSRN